RAQLSPSDKGSPQTFTEQRTVVPPVQVGGESQTTTTFGVPAQDTTIMNPLDMPGQSMPASQELGSDLSLLNPQPFSSPDIPQAQVLQGRGSFMQNFLACIARSNGDGIDSSINKSMFGQSSGVTKDPIVDVTADDLF